MAVDEHEEGWPDVPGDTALTIKVPEAGPLVRGEIPAHVTVLYPFLPTDRIDARTDRRLAALFGSRGRFTLRFCAFRRYPGVLVLDPHPADPILALTKALRAQWPELVPYRGIFGAGGLEPHMTVSRGEGPDEYQAVYDRLESEIAPLLPLSALIEEVHLITWDGAAWRDRTRYPLGGGGAGPKINGMSLRPRMRKALLEAMRARDQAAVSALRATLAALDNAEAVPVGEDALRGVALEQSPVGAGVTEAARRGLSEPDEAEIVRAEADERLEAAAQLTAPAHADRAERLRAEAAVLQRLLGGV